MRRDETCTARGLTFTICRYPSPIKSLLHPVKISESRKGGRSCANISGSRVARYCNLTYDPPLPTQLYLKHTSLPVCLYVCPSACHHGFVIGRFLTTDRAGSCPTSCILICTVLRKLCPIRNRWPRSKPSSVLVSIPIRGLG